MKLSKMIEVLEAVGIVVDGAFVKGGYLPNGMRDFEYYELAPEVGEPISKEFLSREVDAVYFDDWNEDRVRQINLKS